MMFGKKFRITGFGNYSYIAISLTGELYWNFQVPGVIVGMLLVGLYLRFLYRRFVIGGANPEPLRLAMYVVLMMTTIVSAEATIGALQAYIVKQTVILVGIEKMLLFYRRVSREKTQLESLGLLAVRVPAQDGQGQGSPS